MVATREKQFVKTDDAALSAEVNQPSHYAEGRKYEPIDVIHDWDLSFCVGTAVKYCSRLGRKGEGNEIKDLSKAIWYLNYEVDRLKALKAEKGTT
jgi:hypothetical protein